MMDIPSIARRFRRAEETGSPTESVSQEINHSIDRAYDIQDANVSAWVEAGRKQVGWKIGLTSEAARKQMQATEPMFGALFSDMEIGSEDVIPTGSLISPRIEPEIEIVLKRDISGLNPSIAELSAAIDFALPAFEIVDCRSRDWKISGIDAIADNALASGFVLGTSRWSIEKRDLAALEVHVEVNGAHAGTGTGANCMGHPLAALQWLGQQLHNRGRNLSCGDLILTGSLCPMLRIAPNDAVSARFGDSYDLSVHVQ